MLLWRLGKQSDLAYIKAYGYNGADITKPLTDPRKYDVVFNTVPKMIINRKYVKDNSVKTV